MEHLPRRIEHFLLTTIIEGLIQRVDDFLLGKILGGLPQEEGRHTTDNQYGDRSAILEA